MRPLSVLALAFILALALALLLAGCHFDSTRPKLGGAFGEHIEWAGDPGDGGFTANREIDGALNKFRAGWPAVLRFMWRFDWPLGRKLPGEK